MRKLKIKKHYCEECGKELSEQEYINNDSLCNKCYESLSE